MLLSLSTGTIIITVGEVNVEGILVPELLGGGAVESAHGEEGGVEEARDDGFREPGEGAGTGPGVGVEL